MTTPEARLAAALHETRAVCASPMSHEPRARAILAADPTLAADLALAADIREKAAERPDKVVMVVGNIEVQRLIHKTVNLSLGYRYEGDADPFCEHLAKVFLAAAKEASE